MRERFVAELMASLWWDFSARKWDSIIQNSFFFPRRQFPSLRTTKGHITKGVQCGRLYNRGSGWHSLPSGGNDGFLTAPFPSHPAHPNSPSSPIQSRPISSHLIPSHPFPSRMPWFPHPENPLVRTNQGQHSLQAGRVNSCYHCPLPPPICLPNFLNLLIHPADKIDPARSRSPSSPLQKGT